MRQCLQTPQPQLHDEGENGFTSVDFSEWLGRTEVWHDERAAEQTLSAAAVFDDAIITRDSADAIPLRARVPLLPVVCATAVPSRRNRTVITD